MQSAWERRLRSTGILLAVTAIAAILVAGCGGSSDATATQSKKAAAAKTSPSGEKQGLSDEEKIYYFMKKMYGNAKWFPYITQVMFSEGSASVVTELKNRDTPDWNRRQAAAMCNAFLTSPLIQTASIFYDEEVGGSTASCVKKSGT